MNQWHECLECQPTCIIFNHVYLCMWLSSQAIDLAVNALRSHVLNLNPIVEKNVIKVPIPKWDSKMKVVCIVSTVSYPIEELQLLCDSHVERHLVTGCNYSEFQRTVRWSATTYIAIEYGRLLIVVHTYYRPRYWQGSLIVPRLVTRRALFKLSIAHIWCYAGWAKSCGREWQSKPRRMQRRPRWEFERPGRKPYLMWGKKMFLMTPLGRLRNM